MEDIIFNDKDMKPGKRTLAKKIGTNFKYLEEIKNHIKETYSNPTEEWKFYGKKYGWQLKKSKKVISLKI